MMMMIDDNDDDDGYDDNDDDGYDDDDGSSIFQMLQFLVGVQGQKGHRFLSMLFIIFSYNIRYDRPTLKFHFSFS